MSYDGNKLARHMIMIMQVMGMWHFDDPLINRLYRIYGWSLHMLFTIAFIALIFARIDFTRGAESLSRILYLSLTEISLLIKVLNALLRAKHMVILLKRCESWSEGWPANWHERQLVTRAAGRFRHMQNTHYLLTSGYVLGIFVSTMSKDSYTLPHTIWWPYNYNHDAQHYYPVCCYYFMSLLITAICNCTLDVVQSYLLFRISIYNALLGSRLVNLGRSSINVQDELYGHIKFHSRISNLTKECQVVISVPVFFQIITSAFVICSSMYLIRNFSFPEDTAEFCIFTVFGMAMLLQIFLPCRFGNEVTTSADLLKTCLYQSDWTKFPLKTRKTIFIYMEFLKYPVVVRAGQYFDIGYGVFVQVINNAYRLYAVLLSIGN